MKMRVAKYNESPPVLRIAHVDFYMEPDGIVAAPFTRGEVGFCEEIATQINNAETIREENKRIIAKADKTYCAYCGAEFPLDDDAASQVSEHIKTCEKHPMRKVEDLLSATELALDASNTHIRQLEREIMELRGTLP